MRIIIPLFGRIFDLLSRPCQGKWRGVVSDMPILVHNFFRPFDPLFGVVVPTISHSPPSFNSSVNPKLPSSRIEPSGYIYPGPALSKYCRTKLDSNHRIHSTDFWKLRALTKTLRLARPSRQAKGSSKARDFNIPQKYHVTSHQMYNHVILRLWSHQCFRIFFFNKLIGRMV